MYGYINDITNMKMTEEEWDQVSDVNLKGVFNCCKFGAGLMSEQNYGKITINCHTDSIFMGALGAALFSSRRK